MSKRMLSFLLILIFLPLITFAAAADMEPESKLQLHCARPGTIILEGGISVNDRIRLFSREYHSTEQLITDKLLVDTTASLDRSVTLRYDPYAEPLSIIEIKPDFDYQGNEVILKELFAVVSNDREEVYSAPLYTECSLETGVVNQYWCSLAGSTACGTTAAVVAMQTAYPTSGDDLFNRLNTMRKYGLLGNGFSTGPTEYYLNWDHINNAVNKFVSEELGGHFVMVDHRRPDQTTEDTLIGLLTTGRPAVIEVCYLLGSVTRDFQGISHWITINGFSLDADGYTFRFADSITVSYRSISSEMLDESNANVSYGNSGWVPVRYIGAFAEPLFTINNLSGKKKTIG